MHDANLIASVDPEFREMLRLMELGGAKEAAGLAKKEREEELTGISALTRAALEKLYQPFISARQTSLPIYLQGIES